MKIMQNVDLNLVRKQIAYLDNLASEDWYFQGSPLFGLGSADEGLDSVRQMLIAICDDEVTA